MKFNSFRIGLFVFLILMLLLTGLGVKGETTSFNSMSGYVGLFAFFLIAALFKGLINSTGSRQKKEYEEFLRAEHEANFTRASKIPEDMYFQPDVDSLPARDYPHGEKYAKVISAQKRALKKSGETMLRLNPPMRNIEIKQRFGAANLDKIIKYEESYEQYIRALANWAAELIKIDENDDAKKILNICVQMDSLIFLPYSLLCDLYEQEKNTDGFSALKKKAEETSIIADNSVLINKINNCINDKLSKLETS